MDQAHSLRSLVSAKNKILFILTSGGYGYRKAFCMEFAMALGKNKVNATYIETDKNEFAEPYKGKVRILHLDTPAKADDYIKNDNKLSEIYLIGVGNWKFIKDFYGCSVDVIVLTGVTSDSILDAYTQIKLMVMNEMFTGRTKIIKFAVGPAKDAEEAKQVQRNISKVLSNHINYSIESLGWFTSFDADVGEITSRYLKAGGINVKNE